MTAAPIGPGTVLAGRFRLDDLLDDNDGARFWRATDQILARSVAVHVLPDTDPRAGALLDAARSSALVSDGHLLRVLDAARCDGLVYVVNEWGSGVSLDRLLAEGPLSPRRAAWVVKEVAEAIVTAHRSGLAHGRLLPENVMISEAGSVKLIGFVIDATLRSPGGQRRVSDGEPVTALESDVLNLAGLLYAALVVRWPGTTGSTIPPAPTEHGRPLRPRRVRAGVPRPLDAICEQALNAGAHPSAMPIETAHEIFAALGDFIGDPGATTGGGVPPPPGATDQATDRATDQATDQAADPEATQAGTPAFFDEDSGIGAMSHGDSLADTRGLRADGSDPARSEDPAEPRTRRRPAAPPPPPPPDLPERPLFADGPSAAAAAAAAPGRAWAGSSRVAPTTTDDASGSFLGSFGGSWTGGQRSTGAGNGPVPHTWGPDAAGPPPDDVGWDPDGREESMPGRSWLRLAVVLAVVLLVVVGVVFALNLGRGPGKEPSAAASSSTATPSPSATASARLKIAVVTDFDPQGDPPEENPDLTGLAFDGKPGTAWETLTYRGNPKLGGLKTGVGLLVDLGKPASVGEVRLTLMGSPTSLEILAAPRAGSVPTGTDGLSTVASDRSAGTAVDLRLAKRVTTRWLVVWLTSLPPAPGGYQGRIAEISVRS
ncbi:MAG: protein kinase family protein [Nocardioidaceae bacterium]